MDEEERMKILEMIEAGTISAEEGLRLLHATTEGAEPPKEVESDSTDASLRSSVLEFSFTPKDEEQPVQQNPAPSDEEGTVNEEQPEGEPEAEPEPSYSASSSHDFFEGDFEPLPADVEKWRQWWTLPLWVGVAVTVLSGMWMYSAFANQGFSFWFACSWFPFALGVGMMALSYASRRSRWLHVRIQQKPGERPQKIAISMPLPLGLATWFFRYFGKYIPDLPDIQVEEILRAVSESTGPDNPLYVEVDEGYGREKVKIYIG